jgi:hypothetical protein
VTMTPSRLNLHCELCGRRQANGLLSGAAWGKVDVAPGTILRACPSCRNMYPDWESRLRALHGGATEQN